jgi:antitoxin (DNA-binding transcriptional repressor) of toxin-antitoxin stability system
MELLASAAHGEGTVITRRGRPLAVLLPVEAPESAVGPVVFGAAAVDVMVVALVGVAFDCECLRCAHEAQSVCRGGRRHWPIVGAPLAAAVTHIG